MNSLILRVAARFLLPLLLLFSVLLLLRGHNLPGGGFAGGLVAAAALTLYAIAVDFRAARRGLAVDPRTLIATGLLVATVSGIVSMLEGRPFLTGGWMDVHLPVVGETHAGTPLLFDVGVYLVVVGVTLTMVFSLMEEEEEGL
jgi:multicomponent Na+:H+ antiporter subunit B